jgi:hypothetical protein
MSTKAVVNGILKRISVSQIATFDPTQDGGCNRKWFFDKVLQIPREQTAAQEAGTRLHSEIEHYLKTGVNALSKYPLAGLRFIPTPGTVEVEHSIKGFEIDGVPLVGFIDCLNMTPYQILEDGSLETHHPYALEVIDWKTTSDLKYRKSGADLLKTIQMPIYGKYALDTYPDIDRVRLSHVYFTKRGAAKAEKSSAVFSVAEIRERYHNISTVVSAMKTASSCSNVTDLEPNTRACSAFGGCPYSMHCPKSAHQTLNAIFGESKEETMGLFDNVKKPANRPQPSPAKEIEVAKAQLLEEEQRAINAFAPVSKGVVPPDVLPNTRIAEPIPAEELSRFSPEIQRAAQEVAPSQEASLFAPVIQTQDRVLEKMVSFDPGQSAFELYVDCVVSGVETQDLWPILAETIEGIESTHGLGDLRSAPKSHELAYGAWKGALTLAVKCLNLEGRYHLRHVKESEYKQIAVEALSAKAGLLVRGL